MPLLELIVEVLLHNMTCNTSKGHRAVAPGIEAEVEFVVFDPLDATDTFLSTIRLESEFVCFFFFFSGASWDTLQTYSTGLATQVARNCLCNRRLLCHT